MTITPVVYVQESATAGQDDETGFLVKTSFSFKLTLNLKTSDFKRPVLIAGLF